MRRASTDIFTMSYGGGYGGYGTGAGSPNNRPRGVGSFNPNEMGTSYGGNSPPGGYGQHPQFTGRPGGAFNVQDASGGRPGSGGGGYGDPVTGVFKRSAPMISGGQQQYGGGGYGGYAGAPRGADELPPRGALPPRDGYAGGGGGYEGRDPGYGGVTQRAGGYGGGGGYERNQGGVQMGQMGQQMQPPSNDPTQPQGSTFSLASAATSGTSTPGGSRLPSTFVNPQRELPMVQNPVDVNAPRPTFSLANYGITGDNQSAHVRSRAGSGASSPQKSPGGSPPGAGGPGDVRAGSARPMYIGADFPAKSNEVPGPSPASATFAHASTLVQRRLAQNAANVLAGTQGAGVIDGGAPPGDGVSTNAPPNAPTGTTTGGAQFNAARRQQAVAQSNKFDTQRSFTAANLKRPLLSSATLQLHLWIGSLFTGTFIITCLLILIWKGCRLPYPSLYGDQSYWDLDITALAVYTLLEPLRITLGQIANKALKARLMYLSILLAGPGFCLHAYYAWGQTYALKIDVFLNVCGMCFIGAQVSLSLFIVGAFPGGLVGGLFGNTGRTGSNASGRQNPSPIVSAQQRFGGFRMQ